MADTWYPADAWHIFNLTSTSTGSRSPQWNVVRSNPIVKNSLDALKQYYFNNVLPQRYNQQTIDDIKNFKVSDNSKKASVEFLEFAEQSKLLPQWLTDAARNEVQTEGLKLRKAGEGTTGLSKYLTTQKDVDVKELTQNQYSTFSDPSNPNVVWQYRGDPTRYEPTAIDGTGWSPFNKETGREIPVDQASAIRIDRADSANLTQSEAYNKIYNQILNQQQALAAQGFNWQSGISNEETASMMADKLSRAGVKTIYDLETKEIPGPEVSIGTIEGTDVELFGPGPGQTALVNRRTGEAIPPEYAFASMGDTGGTWGGTFAGDGSTRFNVDFVNGVPVFTAQQQATVKSGLEKFAPALAGLGTAALLGPLGANIAAPLAGALSGAVSGLVKSGDIEDALKGAALGGVLGYGKEALFGAGAAGIAASDLAAIEASMGTPGLLGSSNILDAINQAGVYSPDLLSGISPDVAAANLGALEASLGAFSGSTLSPLNFEPVLVPGDSLLSSTLAQPPLSVEDIAGRLTPEATALMGPPTGPMLPQLPSVPSISGGQVTGPNLPDLAGYEEAAGNLLAGAQQNFLNSGLTLSDFMSPETFVGPTAGDPTKAALYGNEGYGPISDMTVTQAPIDTSPITSLGPAANLNDVIDYLKGGAFVGSLGNAFKEAFKAATGAGQQQGKGDGLGGLGPIIGGLLSRAPTAAPSATVTAGRPVDITSPIQALLAPKLVQQRPVSLL